MTHDGQFSSCFPLIFDTSLTKKPNT
jgi:hypothetical protein